MYRAGAPALLEATPAPLTEPAPPRAGLGLRRVVRRRFTGGGVRRIDDDFSARHFADLTGLYGLTYRPELAGPAGNTYAEMARVLAEAVEPDGEPVELCVVAHATPDLDCRYSAVTHLTEAVTGNRLSLSLLENGSCAPYTALRVAAEYGRRHGWRRILVLALDQATLPYEKRFPAGTSPAHHAPAGDAGVALLLTTDGTGAPIHVEHRSGIAPAEALAAAADTLADLHRRHGPVGEVLVDGGGVDFGRLSPAARVAPIGYRATGVFGLLDGYGPGRVQPATALVSYDPQTGDLGVALANFPAARP
ncbi:hypothetical protein Dvina_38580 [Dactylosporangium vinaceum]|uniref:3-oxoacyl-ACP synthase n=1 Tax=Dactylosporangium vinaceum TaxID=53362 RepID=A0ABV5MM03_9ACTN|nr:hypothetical protein [Dactylosporangium vinaceum]UAB94054.1 hypothetical protein Dvina_38580 [Dactylosporangium vinaceum]